MASRAGEASSCVEKTKPDPATSPVRLSWCHTACGKAAQNIRLYQAGMQASRTSGAPNFLPQPDCCPGNRLPHSPALPVAVAIPDSAIPFSGLSVINVRETKMTHSLEIQIEELRAELTGTISDSERREIKIELELAQAELAIITAEQEDRAVPEPPF